MGARRAPEAELERSLLDVVEHGARERRGAVVVPAEYLEVVAVRRQLENCLRPSQVEVRLTPGSGRPQ